MRAASFNFYLYMLISASLLTVALARDEIYTLPLSHTLICFFLSLLGIVLCFFTVTSDESSPRTLIRYNMALTCIQFLLVGLGLLLFLDSDIVLLGTIILAFPAICMWFFVEVCFY